jgi:hypothetical protein
VSSILTTPTIFVLGALKKRRHHLKAPEGSWVNASPGTKQFRGLDSSPSLKRGRSTGSIPVGKSHAVFMHVGVH